MRAAYQNGYRPKTSLSSLAERIYATAFEALENDDVAIAERWFGILALVAPRDERAWIGLAVARERHNDWAMAAARYLLGGALVPGSTWCHFGRARSLRHLGRAAEAEQAFDEAELTTDDHALLLLINEERSAS
jgi:tetratricopeptide (TPR) repeat protein